MDSLLDRFKVRTKLLLVGFIAVFGIVASEGFSLNELWHELNAKKQEELKHLVDTAYSSVSSKAQLAKQGNLSEEEAKQQAIDTVRSMRYAGNEYFFIIDGSNTMVMHPIKPSLDGSNLDSKKDPNGKTLFREMVTVANQNGEGFVDYYWARPGESEPIAKLSFVRKLPQWDWIIATGVYVDDIENAFWGDFQKAALSTALVLVLTLFAVVMVSSSLLKPVRRLQQHMVSVASNRDLTRRVDLKGNDEFAEMGQAFDHMLDSFDGVLQEMTAATSQLASASTELSVTTAQTQTGMVKQMEETQLVATAMTEMSSTVHDVAQNIGEAAHASHNAAQAADGGKSVVGEAMSAVQQLSHQLQQTEDLTHNLEEQSANISSIVEVITGIAEQTNLLALNAAIEAARAGEQGRGFAVVADEVRNLSSRTHESTTEIHQVIQSLQAGSQAAALAMRESKEAADQVVEQAQRTEGSLNEITNAVAQIDMMTTQVASASEQQSAVAEEINANVVNIKPYFGREFSGSEQIARASEELAQLSEHLKEMANRFKVSA